MQRTGTLDTLYDFATGDEDARVCRDVPEAACRHLPGNFVAQLVALVATKTGDRLAGAKLVLAWLLSAVGAPAFMVALLVPIRESLALIPQLLVAALLRRQPIRKWWWAAGSVVQGVCVLGMAVAVLLLQGAAAGWMVLALLVIFSLARGVCSVTAKDVLGKTVSKNRRGILSGWAASIAGALTVAVGLAVWLVRQQDAGSQLFFVSLLVGAGCLWLLAAAAYSMVVEEPGATEGGANAAVEAFASLGLLWTDRTFRAFVITRALLISTALTAPFLVSLASQHSSGALQGLAIMIVANGLAAWVSAPSWGRFADRSSRRVLITAAFTAGLLGIAVYAYAVGDIAWRPEWVYGVAFFLLGIIHTGVRVGRKTYLVDMATADNRAQLVAVSNTVIGILLLSGGLFALLAATAGAAVTVLVLALLAVAGGLSALRLPEVQ